jgi:hypothetical protein
MILRGVLAAIIGTVFMNLSSETEMHVRGRQASVTPGRATNKLLHVVGVPMLEGKRLQVLSTWTHYFYGAAWGIYLWALFDVAHLSVAAAMALFFLGVWGLEQIQLPALKLAPPSWKWGAKEVLIDLWHHVVYATGSVAAWALVGVATR